jgi:hypothetical protein
MIHSTLWRGPASSIRSISSGVTGGGGSDGSVTGIQTSSNHPLHPGRCVDREHARVAVAVVDIGMGGPAWHEHRLAGADRAGLTVGGEGDLPGRDDEQLVLGQVAMRGRATARSDQAIHGEHRSAGLAASHQKRVPVAGSVERAPAADRDMDDPG